MNHQPKSKWYWRLLRWGLIGVAVIVTLGGILLTEENWRGKHAWEAYIHAAEARGERLDVAFITPPPVPDDQNFFCAPIVASAWKSDGQTSNTTNPMVFMLERGDSKRQPKHAGNWQKQTLTDLTEWQKYFRDFNQTPEGRTNGFLIPAQLQSPAEDVLLALSGLNPGIEELRHACERPYARLPISYDKLLEEVYARFPWFTIQKRCMRCLNLRILAELQSGQTQTALDDEKILFHLIDCTRNQPLLIEHMVREHMMTVATQSIYEGLAQHRWNDAQLAELETMLATENFLADFQLSMRGERTCSLAYIETERLTGKVSYHTGEPGDPVETIDVGWTPSAIFYQNELGIAEICDNFLLPLVNPTNRTVSLAVFRAGEKYQADQIKHVLSLSYKGLALMSYSGNHKSVIRFAVTQAGIDLARTACALERYKLAHGEYPVSLDGLAPQFIPQLPHDVINGQPLHYRRLEDGRFLMYSVGWNEQDDGGTVVLKKDGQVDREQGDWVWEYPQK